MGLRSLICSLLNCSLSTLGCSGNLCSTLAGLTIGSHFLYSLHFSTGRTAMGCAPCPLVYMQLGWHSALYPSFPILIIPLDRRDS